LLQRAMLDESDSVQKLIARWLTPLYVEGIAVIRETAGEAGWEADEVPHLALGLFGLVFAWFTNTAALQTLAAGGADPMSPATLATQRRVVEKAIYRLLGPLPRSGERRRKA